MKIYHLNGKKYLLHEDALYEPVTEGPLGVLLVDDEIKKPAKMKGKKSGKSSPGEKRKADREKIAELLDEGMSAPDIAEEVGVSTATVYNVKKKMLSGSQAGGKLNVYGCYSCKKEFKGRVELKDCPTPNCGGKLQKLS